MRSGIKLVGLLALAAFVTALSWAMTLTRNGAPARVQEGYVYRRPGATGPGLVPNAKRPLPS